jgi:hypothetical protein
MPEQRPERAPLPQHWRRRSLSGQRLAGQDEKSGWCDKVVERLAKDLRTALSAMSGSSRTNLFYMRQVYLA